RNLWVALLVSNGSALLGRLGHLVIEVGGQEVVVVVSGGEPTAAAGQGAEVDGVALHLGGGNYGDDDLFAVVARLGALHPAAAGVEVAHDIALVGGRHRDLDQGDGLEDDG